MKFLDNINLISVQLLLKPEQTALRLVNKANSAESFTGVSFQHPEILVHADLVSSVLSEPYYWRLPEQFKGSMVRTSRTPVIKGRTHDTLT